MNIIDNIEDAMSQADKKINKYTTRQKRTILSELFVILGLVKPPVRYPIRILLDDCEGQLGDTLLEWMCTNPKFRGWFNVRSLTNAGRSDKKRLANTIRQIIPLCGLKITRTPLTRQSILDGLKKTIQFYTIEYSQKRVLNSRLRLVAREYA